MNAEQEIRAAALQAAAALYGQMSSGTAATEEDPAIMRSAAVNVQILARQFADYIKPAFRIIQRHRVTNLWSDLRGHG
ncbi:hypothetical protein [Streptomyces mirabilis]|uniref:hypothetical protein n=1 Tax=Streptomyces mirabilis TaxID=68239 RepID=UPI002256B79F|nr:hypothetical protein [Streptomyces mirabilis]MCX4617417.1 hypothetical protein [Streptomyces mirabilis]